MTDVIGIIWKQALLKGMNIPMTISSAFVSGSSVYLPDLSEIKEKYLREVKTFIGWPCESKFIDGKRLLEEENAHIINIYIKIEGIFLEMSNNLKKHSKIE